MKLNIVELKSMAGLAGIDMYTAWGVSDDALLEFTKAIVERCAGVCDGFAESSQYKTQLLAMWCASDIRKLLED